MDLEILDSHENKVEEFETVPAPIYPDRSAEPGGPAVGVVRIPVKYTGDEYLLTYYLRAVLRIGQSRITETRESYAKAWNPPATGTIYSVQMEQPLPHKVNLNVDYAYNPLDGIETSAWLATSILKDGSPVETEFRSAPTSVEEGRHQATVSVIYLGDQIDFTTDQVHPEMSIPDLVLDDSTNDWDITWNPRET